VRAISALASIAVVAGACGKGIFSGPASDSNGGGGGSITPSVYVTNSAGHKVSMFVNSSGTLSSPTTIAAGKANGPVGLTLTPPASSLPIALFVANSADNLVHEFTVTSSGTLSALATIAAGTGPQQVPVTPSGVFAYAINSGGSISEYLINSASGQLSANVPASTTSGLTSPVSGVTTDSFLYVTDSSGGTGVVLNFTITGSGTLATGPGTIATLGPNPTQMTIDDVTSGSTWIFTADGTTGLVSVFQVLSSGGLSLTTSVGTGAAAAGMAFAETPLGSLVLFVANPSLNSVASYTFNSVTGGLLALAVTTGFSSPTGLAVDNPASASTLFVTNNGNGTVSTFSINSAAGGLTSIGSFSTGNPANTSSGPEFVAVTP
jgi:6-phosphogluconolactonase (cycloisomerase 2 family)